jgi:hypothetical protein
LPRAPLHGIHERWQFFRFLPKGPQRVRCKKVNSKSKGLQKPQQSPAPSPNSAGRESPQPQTQEQLSERPREPRHPIRDPVEIENAPGGRRLPGFVLDVSRSGLQLELGSPIGIGTKIKITFPAQFIVFGDVCYCRRAGAVFHADVLIGKVLYSSHAADRHLKNAELNLLKSGEGLTAAKVMELRKHLIHCKTCESRLEEAMAAQFTSKKRPE